MHREQLKQLLMRYIEESEVDEQTAQEILKRILRILFGKRHTKEDLKEN